MIKVLRRKDDQMFLVITADINYKVSQTGNRSAATQFTEEEAAIFAKFFPEYEVVNAVTEWGIFLKDNVLSARYTGGVTLSFEITTGKAFKFPSRQEAENFLHGLKFAPDSGFFSEAYVRELKD